MISSSVAENADVRGGITTTWNRIIIDATIRSMEDFILSFDE
jgi:hypothetical protein